VDYLTSLFHPEGIIDPTNLDRARIFIKDKQEKSKLTRGPFLAEVNLNIFLI